jgi:hypothetical protein
MLRTQGRRSIIPAQAGIHFLRSVIPPQAQIQEQFA